MKLRAMGRVGVGGGQWEGWTQGEGQWGGWAQGDGSREGGRRVLAVGRVGAGGWQ